MKAEYYDKNQLWIVKLKDKEIKFPIELVTVELIEYWAKLKDKIGKDIGWESLSQEDKKELLEWFEKDVFPTKEFGEFLIDELTDEALEVITQQEEEEAYIPSFSDVIKQVRNSYLETLGGWFSPFLKKEDIKQVAVEEYNFRKTAREIADEIINEWRNKNELNSRLEAIREGDVYAIEDLKQTLFQKASTRYFNEVLDYLRNYPIEEE
jgi:acylphosphatase